MFKVGDIVYVSNPDKKYEEENGIRKHQSFFGIVTEINEYPNEICVFVKFPATPNGCETEWAYDEDELSSASDLKDLTLEEFSNKFGVIVMAEYI